MRAASVPVLALLAACGPSADHRYFDAFRATCEGLVASGATIQDAAQRFGWRADVTLCPASLPPLAGVDQCDYQAGVCRVFWWAYARDQSLCGPPGLGGCYYWCEVRAPGSSPPPPTTVVCGAGFVSGQPCPPYAC